MTTFTHVLSTFIKLNLHYTIELDPVLIWMKIDALDIKATMTPDQILMAETLLHIFSLVCLSAL